MRLPSFPRSFPFGYAPSVLVGATLIAGAWLLAHPIPETTATLRLWVFAKTHYNAYVALAPSFEARHPGTKLDIQLVHGEAVTRRLQAAFWADLDVPDVVEVEISVAGMFFRGPESEVGFVDLVPWLRSSGLADRIVRTRFAPYTHRGRIYGAPHDVHPVMLAYRRDIFEEEGVDVSGIETWEDFIAAGRRLTREGERYMMELSDVSAGHFEVCLFQRDGGYFDADGNLRMDDETAVETMRWYVPLVAGRERIANSLGGGQVFTQAVEKGYLLTFLCPDWRSKFFEVDVPRMGGKMALMPLPAAQAGGRRTSTWGGTMIGITRRCGDKDLAWQLVNHLYFDPEERAQAFRETNILPPIKDGWSRPAFDEARPYWSNQRVGALYRALADEVPPQYTSPYIQMTKSKMNEALTACSSYYRARGEEGFEAYVRATLKEAADEVRVLMGRNPF